MNHNAFASAEQRDRQNSLQSNLQFALQYNRLGLSVIPIKPRSKKPAIRSWKKWQQQRADEDQIRTWFADTDPETLGIAIVCGQVSGGLLVRDFDQKPAYEAWHHANPELAATIPTVATARGCHVYARCNDYTPASSFVRVFGDGELRGDGHYVIAPPSIHNEGSRYSWAAVPSAIPTIPLQKFLDSEKCYTGCICVTLADVPAEVEAAIRRTVPLGFGERDRCIFRFVRELKALYRDCDDPGKLLPFVEAWHQAALPTMRTKDFDVTYKAFVYGWERVKYASSEGSLQAATLRALSAELPDVDADPFHKRLLLSLCRELQVERSDRPFYLSARDAAHAIELGGENAHIKAHRWLQEFCRSGWLQLVSVGSRVRRRANEYRYTLPLCNTTTALAA